MTYRYRYHGGTTRGARDRFDRILPKLGRILSVKGYRYRGRYGAQWEAVLVRGTKGTARFSGLLWGYGGEGPHGTQELLVKLGLSRSLADQIAFHTVRAYPENGADWVLYFMDHPNRSYKRTWTLLRKEQPPVYETELAA